MVSNPIIPKKKKKKLYNLSHKEKLDLKISFKKNPISKLYAQFSPKKKIYYTNKHICINIPDPNYTKHSNMCINI